MGWRMTDRQGTLPCFIANFPGPSQRDHQQDSALPDSITGQRPNHGSESPRRPKVKSRLLSTKGSGRPRGPGRDSPLPHDSSSSTPLPRGTGGRGPTPTAGLPHLRRANTWPCPLSPILAGFMSGKTRSKSEIITCRVRGHRPGQTSETT